jgi:hypothetical protein
VAKGLVARHGIALVALVLHWLTTVTTVVRAA